MVSLTDGMVGVDAEMLPCSDLLQTHHTMWGLLNSIPAHFFNEIIFKNIILCLRSIKKVS